MGDLRVGVLGGTFNPIHLGHIHIAREIQKIFSLTHVYFVVASVPPHKPLEELLPFAHRYAMVSLATAGITSFVPSLIELEPEASPYSVDTMAKLARRFGKGKEGLYFIAGGDSLHDVQYWKDSEELLSSYNFVFASRPGIQFDNPAGILPEKVAARIRDFTGMGSVSLKRRVNEESGKCLIYVIDVAAPDISATRIRSLARAGKPVKRFVPGLVGEYINKLHLYGER